MPAPETSIVHLGPAAAAAITRLALTLDLIRQEEEAGLVADDSPAPPAPRSKKKSPRTPSTPPAVSRG